jgi:hypothetical protein
MKQAARRAVLLTCFLLVPSYLTVPPTPVYGRSVAIILTTLILLPYFETVKEL